MVSRRLSVKIGVPIWRCGAVVSIAARAGSWTAESKGTSTTVVPVVPLQAANSLDCKWTLPSGDWKLSVYCYGLGTYFTCQNAVRPVVHVP